MKTMFEEEGEDPQPTSLAEFFQQVAANKEGLTDLRVSEPGDKHLDSLPCFDW